MGAMLLFQNQVNQHFVTQSGQAQDVGIHSDEQLPDLSEGSVPPMNDGLRTDEASSGETVGIVPLLSYGESQTEQANLIALVMPSVSWQSESDVLASLEDDHDSLGFQLQGHGGSQQAENQQMEEGRDEQDNAEMIDLPIQSTMMASRARPGDTMPTNVSTIGAATAKSSLPVISPPPVIDPLNKADWIRTRPANHYTLQLLGVEQLQSLKDFVARHGLEEKAYYYETRRKGKPWYPLLWGDYPDKKSALEAIENLPPEIQRQGYWIRQFRDLQTVLHRN
jgi:hypothetical protein